MAGAGVQRSAVVGATGAAGQMTLRILEERKFPVRELRGVRVGALGRQDGHLRGGGRSACEKARRRGVPRASRSRSSRRAPRSRRSTRRWRSGRAPWSWTSRTRSGWTPRFRSSCPEINAHAVAGHQGIVASPNCTTIVTVMPLKPLHDAGRLPARGRHQLPGGVGRRRARASRSCARRRWRGRAARPITPSYFAAPDRLQRDPAHRQVRRRRLHRRGDEAGQRGRGRSSRLPDLLVSPTTVRVPVFTAHSVAVNAETEEKITVGAGARALRALPGPPRLGRAGRAALSDAGDVEGQDDCVVGRVREDLSTPRGAELLGRGRSAPQGRGRQRRADRGAARSAEPVADRPRRAVRPPRAPAGLRRHGLHGWQVQPGASTVQGLLIDACARLVAGGAASSRREPHRRGRARPPPGGEPAASIRR